jgi:hypothetical protein
MAIQITTSNDIIINSQRTGLKVAQRQSGTAVYTPEVPAIGQAYEEHEMPYTRYSTAHDTPCKPGQSYDPKLCAGAAQFEADVVALLAALHDANPKPKPKPTPSKN